MIICGRAVRNPVIHRQTIEFLHLYTVYTTNKQKKRGGGDRPSSGVHKKDEDGNAKMGAADNMSCANQRVSPWSCITQTKKKGGGGGQDATEERVSAEVGGSEGPYT